MQKWNSYQDRNLLKTTTDSIVKDTLIVPWREYPLEAEIVQTAIIDRLFFAQILLDRQCQTTDGVRECFEFAEAPYGYHIIIVGDVEKRELYYMENYGQSSCFLANITTSGSPDALLDAHAEIPFDTTDFAKKFIFPETKKAKISLENDDTANENVTVFRWSCEDIVQNLSRFPIEYASKGFGFQLKD